MLVVLVAIPTATHMQRVDRNTHHISTLDSFLRTSPWAPAPVQLHGAYRRYKLSVTAFHALKCSHSELVAYRMPFCTAEGHLLRTT